MRTVANYDIPTYAAHGKDAQGYGNLKTYRQENGYTHGVGILPRKLANIFYERRNSITQVIYSYNTPIAWLDAGAWIVPAVSYSITTSKHQSYLYRLPSTLHSIPWDCSMDEYMRVLNAKMIFVGHGDKMRTRPFGYLLEQAWKNL